MRPDYHGCQLAEFAKELLAQGGSKEEARKIAKALFQVIRADIDFDYHSEIESACGCTGCLFTRVFRLGALSEKFGLTEWSDDKQEKN